MKMMRGSIFALVALAAATASAQVTMSPMVSFGGGDGWLAPGENAFLANDNNVRSMAYNRATGKIVFASRTGGVGVHLLDGSTGTQTGSLNVAGVTGGTFAVNGVGVSGDGKIYVSNLTTNTASSVFKVYEWSDETASAVNVISSNILAGARLGDSIDVTGSGANTKLAFGFGSSPVIAGNNGYAVFEADGSGGFNGTAVGFTGLLPNPGDFRLGITFGPGNNSVWGSQGASVMRVTTFAGAAGTLTGSAPLSAGNERAMDFAIVNGKSLLATMDTGSSSAPNSGTGVVRVYDVTDPLAPVLMAQGKNTGNAVLNTNGNATGSVAFGDIVGNRATLYAMSTNNGIQAFELEVVPEPATMTALALGAAAMLRRRKR